MAESLADRVRRVTEDLRQFHQELEQAVEHSGQDGEQARKLDELLDQGLMDDFRAAVDHLRHLIWAYLQASGEQSGVGADRMLQVSRMRRVTEMVRHLRDQLDLPELRASPEARTLLEELSSFSQSTVDRHMAPAGGDSKPRRGR
ncbi:MAG TPA: hypothetical protein VLE48_01675 [Terriglobales bacterium]|nr:hypothetical protein [Terriglobales bacterium]